MLKHLLAVAVLALGLGGSAVALPEFRSLGQSFASGEYDVASVRVRRGLLPSINALRPALSLRFADRGRLDSRITYTGGVNRTYFDAYGVLQDSSINVARFDHDMATGTPRGISVWEGRENGIRTNDGTGASAGTPGTPPTNWVISGNGTTQEIVAVGTTAGINTIDLRFSGTPSGDLDIKFESATGINAVTTEIWAFSSYIALIAGDLTNITTINLQHRERQADGTFVKNQTGSDIKGSLTSTLQRFVYTATLDGGVNTAHVMPTLFIDWDGSGAIDLTLRIGLPQEEQGAGASPVIKTTNAAVTATADAPTISDMSWFNPIQGTFFFEATISTQTSAGQFIFQVDKGGTNNVISVQQGATFGRLAGITTNSGGDDGLVTLIDIVTDGVTFKGALAYANDDLAFVAGGGTVGTDNTATFPLAEAMVILNIGTKQGGSLPINGTIALIEYWNVRLPNGVLIGKTALLDGTMFAANDNEEWLEAVGY